MAEDTAYFLSIHKGESTKDDAKNNELVTQRQKTFAAQLEVAKRIQAQHGERVLVQTDPIPYAQYWSKSKQFLQGLPPHVKRLMFYVAGSLQQNAKGEACGFRIKENASDAVFVKLSDFWEVVPARIKAIWFVVEGVNTQSNIGICAPTEVPERVVVFSFHHKQFPGHANILLRFESLIPRYKTFQIVEKLFASFPQTLQMQVKLQTSLKKEEEQEQEEATMRVVMRPKPILKHVSSNGKSFSSSSLVSNAKSNLSSSSFPKHMTSDANELVVLNIQPFVGSAPLSSMEFARSLRPPAGTKMLTTNSWVRTQVERFKEIGSASTHSSVVVYLSGSVVLHHKRVQAMVQENHDTFKKELLPLSTIASAFPHAKSLLFVINGRVHEDVSFQDDSFDLDRRRILVLNALLMDKAPNSHGVMYAAFEKTIRPNSDVWKILRELSSLQYDISRTHNLSCMANSVLKKLIRSSSFLKYYENFQV